jgi:hypothetical protein
MPERTTAMRFERRDFIKIGSAGLTAGIVNPGLRLAQASTTMGGEMEGGTGYLRLEGKLKTATLILEAQDFMQGLDRTVIVHGLYKSKKFYAKMFSHNRDRTVFAILGDEVHSTTIVLSDSDVAEIGRLILWHDNAATDNFRIKKADFLDKEAIVDEARKPIEFSGKRDVPDFTQKELESVFGNDAELLRFMRGKRSLHKPTQDQLIQEWICKILSILPGSPFTLFWAAF